MNVHASPLHLMEVGGSGESEHAGSLEPLTTIYRPVLIHAGGFSGFCLVRNISATGLIGMVYADLPKDQPIAIGFSDKLTVGGAVAWSREGRVGVAFDQPIDVAAVLHDLGRKMIDDRVNRAPRLAIRCPVTLEEAQRTEDTIMHNISQRGLRVSSVTLHAGDEVFVHLAGMEARKAVVRWASKGMAGLNFVRPLEFDRLANWAIDLQAQRWAEQGREA